MLFMIFFTYIFAQNPSAEERANQHLQDLYQKQNLEQKRSNIMQQKYGNEEVRIDAEEPNANSYGVIQEAPEEANPNFQDSAVIYKANPLEQAYQEAEQERADRRYQNKQYREFKNNYIRNAEADGVEVYIDENDVVEDLGQRKQQPIRRNPSSGRGGQN